MIGANLLFANITLVLVIWGIAAMILYTIIMIAVRNGVREATREANERQEQQLQSIQDLVFALVQDKYKKPDQ